MIISPMDPNMTIPCGICHKDIPALKLKVPVSISNWDKQNGAVREYVHNCCGYTWLFNMDYNGTNEKSTAQGPAVVQ